MFKSSAVPHDPWVSSVQIKTDPTLQFLLMDFHFSLDSEVSFILKWCIFPIPRFRLFCVTRVLVSDLSRRRFPNLVDPIAPQPYPSPFFLRPLLLSLLGTPCLCLPGPPDPKWVSCRDPRGPPTHNLLPSTNTTSF